MTRTKNPDGYDATITDVFYGKEDHGILTISIGLDFDDGGHQGFGGLCLSEPLAEDFERCVCAIFNARKLDELKGRRCRALFNFKGWNENIAALETGSPGAGQGVAGSRLSILRFTINTWRKRHFPETTSVLEQRLEKQRHHIKCLKLDLERAKATLKEIPSTYIDLENP